jgi:hypothetical protein
MTEELLPTEVWHKLRDEHKVKVMPWITPRLERRSRHESHPVDDFLFEYYPISTNKLLTWHAGFGISLHAIEDEVDAFPSGSYEFVDSKIQIQNEWLAKNQEAAINLLSFLTKTQERPVRSGCFGLHEWAMVLGSDEVRHEKWPLRLSQEQIRATIDEVGLRCTHFDAFRFFTPTAAPLNPLQLTPIDRNDVEQPGCLHANMDLYKHAQRFAPIFGSNIVRAAFALAKDIRTVDMQTAPYDLAELGVIPIPVETQAGRDEFANQQLQFASRAQILRTALIDVLKSGYVSAEIKG